MVRSRYIDLGHYGSQDTSWDGYRLGSETCHRLLPSLETMERLTGRFDAGKLTLVTPMAGQGTVSAVVRVVQAAMDLGWSEVVLNDWGILEKLSGSRFPGSDCSRQT